MQNFTEATIDVHEKPNRYRPVITQKRCEKCMIALIFFIVGVVLRDWFSQINNNKTIFDRKYTQNDSISSDSNEKSYVFVGGHESSGTGLMRIQLDAHPDIRCGAEPMISLEVLHLWQRFANPPMEKAIKAGIYPDAINNATRAFIEQTIEHMGPKAKVLCHKQPTTFRYLSTLYKLFPKSKFIHMVRDGRGAVTSSINRNLLGKDNPNQSLLNWQQEVRSILEECVKIGPNNCINVRYESLVLNTEKELRRILDFIGVAWDPIVLHHEKIVDQLTNLNSFEPSTIQFRKAVHTNSLLAWAQANGSIPKDVLEKSCETITLLRQLNYCPPSGYIPNYNEIPAEITYS